MQPVGRDLYQLFTTSSRDSENKVLSCINTKEVTDMEEIRTRIEQVAQTLKQHQMTRDKRTVLCSAGRGDYRVLVQTVCEISRRLTTAIGPPRKKGPPTHDGRTKRAMGDKRARTSFGSANAVTGLCHGISLSRDGVPLVVLDQADGHTSVDYSTV